MGWGWSRKDHFHSTRARVQTLLPAGARHHHSGGTATVTQHSWVRQPEVGAAPAYPTGAGIQPLLAPVLSLALPPLLLPHPGRVAAGAAAAVVVLLSKQAPFTPTSH